LRQHEACDSAAELGLEVEDGGEGRAEVFDAFYYITLRRNTKNVRRETGGRYEREAYRFDIVARELADEGAHCWNIVVHSFEKDRLIFNGYTFVEELLCCFAGDS